ncbi:MAG: hypothetical protein FWD93_06225 [Coriobacteriia bacterium]|nr:hypothetical protein [Coriobacteriia bacterium]
MTDLHVCFSCGSKGTGYTVDGLIAAGNELLGQRRFTEARNNYEHALRLLSAHGGCCENQVRNHIAMYT